jgi:hypothetical protein
VQKVVDAIARLAEREKIFLHKVRQLLQGQII